ncbi:MAG: heme exporter protein CcmB [Pseudomonadota bacterium]
MKTFLALLHKDLLVGWRGRVRLVGLFTYSLSLLLLFSFAVGPDTAALRDHASAYIWLAVLSASTLLLAQSFQQEVEAGAIEGLLLLPVEPAALYYAKALANLLLLLFLAFATLPLAGLLFSLVPAGSLPMLLLVVALGAAGIVAPGTLYAALTARLSSQQVVLPVLLFPLVIPPILAAVKATDLVLEGDAMGELPAWLGLLLVFDAIYWALSGPLFGKVMEE